MLLLCRKPSPAQKHVCSDGVYTGGEVIRGTRFDYLSARGYPSDLLEIRYASTAPVLHHFVTGTRVTSDRHMMVSVYPIAA
jgi:hypothetical protein